MKNLIVIAIICMFTISCSKNKKVTKPYIIEVTTFQYKATVDAEKFWAKDAKIEAEYTSKQHGFISRESGYSSDDNQVVVVVKWEKKEDADASMKKFISDKSVGEYVNMIDSNTMNMKRYIVR